MERNNASIRYFSSVNARIVDWLWYPYIPFGKITIVQGDPGDGKTTLVLNIAALLSNGLSMPESDFEVAPAKIIYQSAEDGMEDTLKPRLVSAGADCSRIAFIDESESGLTLSDTRIEDAIRETGAQMVVLDPLQAYLGENNEMNRVNGIRPMMKQLAAVAERTGCAIIIIGHMNKASGTKGIYRGLGSIDITAAARSVLLVGRIRSNPSIRAMAQLKNSLAPEGKSIAFEINDSSSIRWIGEYDITAEELLLGDGLPEEGGKLSETTDALRAMLQNEKIACTSIYKHFRGTGVSKRTVDTAKKTLEIKSTKHADGWYWSL
jgi:RecA-family ATPase